MLGTDPARAFYGPGHVLAAAELGAIQVLLISGAGVRVPSGLRWVGMGWPSSTSPLQHSQ